MNQDDINRQRCDEAFHAVHHLMWYRNPDPDRAVLALIDALLLPQADAAALHTRLIEVVEEYIGDVQR